MVECFGDVLTEGVASTTGGDAPAAPVVRVGPEQVAHRTLKIFLVVIMTVINISILSML